MGTALWGGGGFGGGGGAPVAGTVKASDIIYRALRKAGILRGAQRGQSNAENADGLICLNELISSWSIDGLNIYTIRIDQYATIANKQSYTIGVDPAGVLTADWAGSRPVFIKLANLLFSSSPSVRRPIELLTDEQWADIRVQEIYTLPSKLYNDGNYPLSTLYFWPIPDTVYQIELYTWQALGDGQAALDTAVVLPPGYERALVANLAIELCAMFPLPNGAPRPVSPAVAEIARVSKAALQSMNIETPRLRTDPSFAGTHGGGAAGGHFNWRSGMNQ